MAEKKGYSNKLGLMGWISGGRYGVERYVYTLHRLAGLGILLYFVLHIFVTATRVQGEAAWESVMGTLENPLFKIGEFLVFLAFAFHGLNGIRLILVEFGIFLGKPRQPIYPYKQSTLRQRPVLVVMMVLAAVLMIVGGWDFFLLK